MHPFALASANDPATAIAAHADDPELAFIAGGTDRIGLMKDRAALPIEALPDGGSIQPPDRKSTRLNSSHGYISYAVFCLKKKKIHNHWQVSYRTHYGSGAVPRR